MKVLITGAAGFLGSHLSELFLSEGHSVVAMDNFLTGDPQNISHLIGNDNFHFIKHDVSNFIFVPGKIDAVLHFASPASPNKNSPYGYPNLPIQTMKAGALGTHNALGVAKANNAKFLLASTSEIYGDPQEHPQKETYWGHVDPTGPRSMYDEAKRFAEALTMAYHRFHGIDTRIVRIFNTYGPRMRLDDGRVIPNFIQQALRNEPLTIYGEGKQTRSFCFYQDLINGIYALLNSEIHDPVNIGNPNEMTMIELAEQINNMTGNTAGLIINESMRLGNDPERRQPDITKASKLLNWTPKFSLENGLSLTIPYFKDKLGL
jgi:dTDP-glucose 4,6-dehydratase